MSSRRSLALLRLVVASLIGWAAIFPAGASTLVRLSVEELCQRATLIVAATPVQSTVVWEDGGARGRRIVTYTRVRIDRVIDGAAPAELWVRTLGGTVGDIGQRVDGEAILSPGQPGVFFLRPFADGPHAVVGMAQGQFRLQRPLTGAAPKLAGMPTLPRLLAGAAQAGAAVQLEGKTLDEASQIIRAARQAHAP